MSIKTSRTPKRLLYIMRESIVGGLLWGVVNVNRSDYLTQVATPRKQPVPFSHKHHVSGIGLDCRHCHTPVEESAFAGLPATKTCMTCHSQVWSDSPMLSPCERVFRKTSRSSGPESTIFPTSFTSTTASMSKRASDA